MAPVYVLLCHVQMYLIGVCSHDLAFGFHKFISVHFTLHYFPHIYIYVLSVTVLTLWVAPPEMFCSLCS